MQRNFFYIFRRGLEVIFAFMIHIIEEKINCRLLLKEFHKNPCLLDGSLETIKILIG